MKKFDRENYLNSRKYIINRVLNSIVREHLLKIAVIKLDTFEININGHNLIFQVNANGFLQEFSIIGSQWLMNKKKTSNLIRLLTLIYNAYDIKNKQDLNFAIKEYKAAILHTMITNKIEIKNKSQFCDSLSYYDHLASFKDHPLYPTARAKLGFTIQDLEKYTPEYGNFFKLKWVAVNRKFCSFNQPKFDFWPTAKTFNLEEKLNKNYIFLPIHPKFHKKSCDILVAKEIDFIKVGTGYLDVRPTLSIRTLVLKDMPHIHIKIPLDIRTLSTKNIRLIKPSTINDGDIVHNILNRIKKLSPDIDDKLLLCHEKFGGNVADLMEIGFLIRTYPKKIFSELYEVIPIAALTACENKHLVIDKLVKKYFHNDYLGFFKNYVFVQLKIHLTLVCKYGVALEANQQNSMLILNKKTKKMQIILKDNDAPRIHIQQLINAYPQFKKDINNIRDSRIKHNNKLSNVDMFNTIIWQLNIACILNVLITNRSINKKEGNEVLITTFNKILTSMNCPREISSLLKKELLNTEKLTIKCLYSSGTLLPKSKTSYGDINKFYKKIAPNFLK